MRIVHIGHGRLPIPPTQWGAVEDIIWNYKHWCEIYGHEFLVVNEPDPEAAMWDAHNFNPDIAHLHDETKIGEFEKLAAPIKIVTTHDPTFFEKPNPFIERFVKGDFWVGCLSQPQAHGFYKRGMIHTRMLLTYNGARSDLFRFTPEPLWPHKMVCLGMIGQRKRQNLLLPLEFVDCIGPVATYDPIATSGVVFESWYRKQVYHQLTNYSALVLLSKSEADPLVVKEALMAGLDVIVSEAASANLDRSQPFVHVLPESTINNPFMLRVTLERILKTPRDRVAVRKYAEEHFDWSVLVKRYLATLFRLLKADERSRVEPLPLPVAP